MGTVTTATVLMTDLVGSTALAMAIGPESADRLRQEHFGLLRGPLAEHGGREVKNLGDGLMVVFASASGAAHAAVAIQQAIERRNRSAEQPLSVRIGVTMGEADVEEGDYFGRPVVEASRLCAHAEGGQIVVSDVVRSFSGARGGLRFADLGALVCKGIPEPVPASEVEWEPLDEAGRSAPPLPAPLRGVPLASYVGRAEERAVLADRWRAARDGERGVVLVSGEPGIGKSRLAAHASLDAHGDGATVLLGRCSQDVGAAFGPWSSALEHLVEHADEALLRAHVERHRAEAVRLAPGLARRVPDLPPTRVTDPETGRYLLFQAVTDLLQRAASERPVLLVIDDAHWIDAPSLALARFVVEATANVALLVVVTYRDSELADDEALTGFVAEMARHDGTVRVSLSGLPPPDVAAMVAAAVGRDLEAGGVALAAALSRETDGNPFFVGELLRHLVESGAVDQGPDGRWGLTADVERLPLPASVRDVIGRRVAVLGDETQRTLGVAAVIGREFELALLARALGEDEEAVLDRLERAAQASIVAESAEDAGRFAFGHALIDHTLYEALGRTRRARWHGAIAEAIEALHGDDLAPHLGDLARHWAAAARPAGDRRAIDYAIAAGRQALDALAPDDALRWFSRADALLSAHPVDDWRPGFDVLLGRGEAERWTGFGDFRQTLLDASRLALEHDDVDRVDTAVVGNARGPVSQFGEIDTERVALIDAALAADHPGRTDARRAQLLSRLSLELLYEPGAQPRRRALSDEALALAQPAGDDRALGEVLRERGMVLWTLDGDPVARAANAQLLAEVAGRSADPALRFWSAEMDAHLALVTADIPRIVPSFGRASASAQRLGQPVMLWMAAYDRACWSLHSDLDAAEADADAALAIGNAGGVPDAVLVWSAQTVERLAMQGRMEALGGLVAATTRPDTGAPAFDAAQASILALFGARDQASVLLRDAMDRRFDVDQSDTMTTTALLFWTETAVRLRATDVAGALDVEWARCTHKLVYNGVMLYHPVAVCRGLVAELLGRHEEADRRLADGFAILDQLGLPLAWSRPLLSAAEVLAPRDRDRARDLAGRALELGRSHGADGITAQADALLASFATSPRR